MTAVGQPPRLSHAIRVEPRRAFHKPFEMFIAGVAMGCATAVLSWIFGARLGARFAQRCRDKLASFLADPDRG